MALCVAQSVTSFQPAAWRRAPGVVPRARTATLAAFDPGRMVIVLLAAGEWGSGLWEWTGTVWVERDQGTAAPGLPLGASLAFDHCTGEVLMIDGFATSPTWTWNGVRWLQRISGQVPAAMGAALASDPVRGRTYLFGGRTSTGPSTDTWEWDGIQWRLLTPAHSPPVGEGTVMAFDPQAGVLILAGPVDAMGTWSWNGQDWTRIPGAAPHCLWPICVTDTASHRVLLHGGFDSAGTALAATWERVGGVWRSLPTQGVPPRGGGTGVFDPRAGLTAVLAVVDNNVNIRGEHWILWPNRTWTVRTDGSSPSWSQWRARGAPRPELAFDRDMGSAFLLDGGLGRDSTGSLQGTGELWRFEGMRWERMGGTLPPGREGAAFCHQSRFHQFVLFGGDDRTNYLDDTWVWNGTVWRRHVDGVSPRPQAGGTLVEDPAGGGLLLFGAFNGAGELWRWTGSNWVFVASGPSGYSRWAATFDTVRSTLVAYGESWSSGSPMPVVAEWDGRGWRQFPSQAPSLSPNCRMVFDERRRVCVLVGMPSSGLGSQTWEYDPNLRIWSLAATAEPWARTNFAMSYDSLRGRVVLCGGEVTATWFYSPDNLGPMSQEVPLGGQLDLVLSLPSDGGAPYVCGLAMGADGIRLDLGGQPAVWPLAPDRLFRITFGLPQLVGQLNGSGNGAVHLPLPADPALSALYLCASVVTLDPTTLSLRSITRDVRAFVRP